MKKLLLTIPLFLTLPFNVFAFNQASYSVLTSDNVLDKVVCDNPTDNIIPWVDNDRINDGFPCNSGGQTFAELFNNFSTTGTYRILECATGSNCGGSGVLDDARIDPDYVSEALLTISGIGGTKTGVLFGRSGESQAAMQSGGSMLAAIGLVSGGAFDSVFPYLMLSAGVFTLFYVIQQLAMFFGRMSGEKVKANWSGEGKMEHEYTAWKKKARSRRKRGLDIE